jgi:hypothetical protein
MDNEDEHFFDGIYVGGIQHLKNKQIMRIGISNSEDEPNCHVLIFNDDIPFYQRRSHPNTSDVQIRLDVAEYYGNQRLTLEERNKFIEEMKRPATKKYGKQVIQITVWERCRICWQMNDTAKRITTKTMPDYGTLEVR